VFGWERCSGLVAVTLEARGDRVRLYRRADGRVTAESAPFTPFLLAADAALVESSGGLVETRRLDGDAAFRWLARFRSWGEAVAARDRCRERSGLASGAPGAPYRFLGDAVQQFLVLTGRTSFAGLAFDDLHRLALDIEVVTSEGFEFPSAARPDDRIVAVALADNRGFRHVIRGDLLDERSLLEELVRIVAERDPDVIEGHNIFRFDLEYLAARARRFGVALALGREGALLRGRSGTAATRRPDATSSTPGCWPRCTTSAPAIYPATASSRSPVTSAWPATIGPTSTPRRSPASFARHRIV
jgi:hypothetical protein